MLVRRGSRLYLYRYCREGNRVVRIYAGAGEQAEQLAAQDQARRQADQEARAGQKAQKEWVAVMDQELDTMCRTLDLLAQATLVASGFYCHKRGEWRRRRHEHDSK